jgi:hypothetical protein
MVVLVVVTVIIIIIIIIIIDTLFSFKNLTNSIILFCNNLFVLHVKFITADTNTRCTILFVFYHNLILILVA